MELNCNKNVIVSEWLKECITFVELYWLEKKKKKHKKKIGREDGKLSLWIVALLSWVKYSKIFGFLLNYSIVVNQSTTY